MLQEKFTRINEKPAFTSCLNSVDLEVVKMTAANFDSDEIAKKLECDFSSVNMKRARIYKDFNDFVANFN